MLLLAAVIFSSLWAFGVGQLKQPEMSISKQKGQSAQVSCNVFATNFNDLYIYWYHQKPNQNIEHLLYVQSTTSPAQKYSGQSIKLEARKDSSTYTSTLKINFLAKEDEGMYYCACWMHNIRLTKITYTKTTSDRNLEGDFSPKPTVFLPSVAEINLHKAGTYLCLLEKFFPDVIKIDWKEKNGDRILKSQEGDMIRTIHKYITYTKFSWLTVPETSMDKDHVCVVKHEFNRGGIDQEIFFPSIMKVKENFSNTYTETTTLLETLTPTGKEDGLENTTLAVVTDENNTDNYLKKFSPEDESRPLQLQLTQTSAYYTYVLLLLKSMVYFAIVAFSLFRRRGSCCNWKIP